MSVLICAGIYQAVSYIFDDNHVVIVKPGMAPTVVVGIPRRTQKDQSLLRVGTERAGYIESHDWFLVSPHVVQHKFASR